jgi:hypothetical protein
MDALLLTALKEVVEVTLVCTIFILLSVSCDRVEFLRMRLEVNLNTLRTKSI